MNVDYPDIIIPVAEKNIKTLYKTIPFVKENIDCDKIYVIANKRLERTISEIPGVTFFDEDEVFPGLSFESVDSIINSIISGRKRAGWYLQQFIEFGWAYKTEKRCFISIDADTFPLNKIDFIDEEGRYIFTKKIEYHKPYFDAIDKLFNGTIRRKEDFSFIAEHMIFDTAIMREMVEEIERNDNLEGTTFFEKILHSVNKEDLLFSGFADFETYGNYMLEKYPEKMQIRTLRTLREGTFLLGGDPTEEQLEWAKRDYDIVSIENANYKKTPMTRFVSLKITRKVFHLKTLARMRKKIRSVYRRIKGIPDFQFD